MAAKKSGGSAKAKMTPKKPGGTFEDNARARADARERNRRAGIQTRKEGPADGGSAARGRANQSPKPTKYKAVKKTGVKRTK